MDQEARRGKTYAFFFSGTDDETSRQMEEYAKANPGKFFNGNPVTPFLQHREHTRI